MAGAWERVLPLDAGWAASAIEAEVGVRLVVEGPCPGGEVGAAYVRWPDGHRSVLSWQPGRPLHELRTGPQATLAALREVGYPGPAVELAVEVPGAVVLVQELLPGRKVEHLTAGLLDQALALIDTQAHVLADRPDVPPVRLHLRTDGPGFCLHEPLRRHGRRAAALERWVREVGEEHPEDLLPGDDAVHVDFHPENLLAVGDTLTGVVDWDGAGRGDRRLDLVTLRFGVRPGHADPGVLDRLEEVIDAIPPGVLRPAWAHMSLRQVDWAIRHFPPAEVDHWIDLAERRAA